ncbi:hypothetical protein [Aurantiacibacter hainanensis]|uniref:hypothetical protein n=1 Tax=Aurantiacibacter hainanensis TaxID=3076114 RepID=UPI0030C73C91
MATRGGSARRPTSNSTYIRWHYPVGTTILLVLSLVAFGDNLVTDIHQPSNSDPKMVIHGLFALAWMVLLVVQANLPCIGKTSLHRSLGKVAFVVGAGTVLTTLYLFVAVWRSWAAMSPEVIANRLLLPSFGIAILAAWWLRRRTDWHRRLIYCGTLFLLSPILSRTYDPLVAPMLPVYPPGEDEHLFLSYLALTWSAMFLGQLLYDWLQSGRFHPASLVTFGWTVVVYCIAYAL